MRTDTLATHAAVATIQRGAKELIATYTRDVLVDALLALVAAAVGGVDTRHFVEAGLAGDERVVLCRLLASLAITHSVLHAISVVEKAVLADVGGVAQCRALKLALIRTAVALPVIVIRAADERHHTLLLLVAAALAVLQLLAHADAAEPILQIRAVLVALDTL